MQQEAQVKVVGRTAVEIAAAVRQGIVSPVEVTRQHLERIEALDGQFHAFQLVRGERALAEAAVLAARPDLGRLPLAGVPIAVKDNIDVAQEPTRRGSQATAVMPTDGDDELVRRLRAAGAIVIGKTVMPELAIWPFTEPEGFPPATRNPWNVERTPGGSTGGGAVAVATGMAPLALGSDGGGSLRVPAACCGIVGLKPGGGVVPLAGGAERHWLGLTQFGPLANSAADLALMLDVLAGRDDFRGSAHPGRPLRLAVSTKSPTAGARVSPEVKAATEALAKVLAGAGHEIVRADPPYPLDLGPRFMRRWLPGIAEDARGLTTDQLESRTRSMARAGRMLRRARLAKPAEADRFARRAASWLGSYDALLTPTLAEPPLPLGTWHGKGWVKTTLGIANWIFTTPWNLAGLPAMSVPAGFAADGLPLGVQLVVSAGREEMLLSLLAQLEQINPWPRWQEDAPGAPS